MEDYITTHYVVGIDEVGIQLPIKEIENLSLNITMLVLTWILGSASLHQASMSLMFYMVECLRPTFYD
jgi:hypothetical protein